MAMQSEGWYLKTDVKGDREWADVKKAEKGLKDLGLKIDEVAPRALLSVAKAQALLKTKGKSEAEAKEIVDAFAVRPDGSPQLKKGQNPNVFEQFAPPVDADPKSVPTMAGA
jgi:hypothetical protein